jgi:Transposase DDE domain
VLVSDRALAKARAKLHVPALWALNERLLSCVETQGQLRLFKGRRLVCADGTLLAPAQRACLRTRSLAAPVQRALGLYLPGNDLMLHVAVGPEAEGERQMLFDQLDRLRRGDVLILDRGYPASWLVQALAQRGIDFVIRCDSDSSWGAARDFLRSGHSECWRWLSPCDVQQASTWELDGPACVRARLVRHVSASGRTRVLVTSLSEDVATVAELADLYHGRWRIEEAFKRLKHRLGLESVSGLSQHALLVDVATKVLADNLTALLNRAVPMAPDSPEGVSRQVNRAAASKLFSRCIGAMLLVAGRIAQGVHDWVLTLSRCWTRHIPGRCRPRNPAHTKPHPSQAYKRAA